MAEPNLYSDPSRDPLTAFGASCVKFPTNLSKMGIPYVLFGPYERQRVISVSGKASESLLDSLPPPQRKIALPIPSSALSTTLSVGYRDASLGGAMGSLAIGGSNVLGPINNLINAAKNVDFTAALESGKQILGELGSSAVDAGLVGALQGLGNISEAARDTVLLLGKRQINPFTEVLYENVPFREHIFTYTFQPKSLHESQEIDKILQYFKFYMLPEFSASKISIPGVDALPEAEGQFGVWLKFPLEWQITYSISDTTFTLLPSVLTSMQVNYADGVDSPKLFKPAGNESRRYPTKIDVSMTFKEVSFLSRNQIVVDDPVNSEDAGVFDDAKRNRTRYRF